MATYIATHPEKLDTQKQLQWQKVASLSPQQMWAVCNLAYLGVAVSKKPGMGMLLAPPVQRRAVKCYVGGKV